MNPNGNTVKLWHVELALVIVFATWFILVGVAVKISSDVSPISIDADNKPHWTRSFDSESFNRTLQTSGCKQGFKHYKMSGSISYLGLDIPLDLIRDEYIVIADNIFEPASKTNVVIRRFKSNMPRNVLQLITENMELMDVVGKHRNLFNFYCYSNESEESVLVYDYVSQGRLREFLQEINMYGALNDPSLRGMLLSLAYQIAEALEYLGSRGFILRKLSSDYIYIDTNDMPKIIWFNSGLRTTGKAFDRTDQLKREFIVPPETLMYHKYDMKSEVWAYGCLLWDIMSLGFAHAFNGNYSMLMLALQNGIRLPKPPICSHEIYRIMLDCWKFRPDQRPTFSEVLKALNQIRNSSNAG